MGMAKETAYPNSPGGGGTRRWYGGGEGERPRGRRRLPACLPVPETERLVVVDGRDATRGANGVAQAVYVGGARGRGGVGAKPSKARGGIGGTKRRPGELGVTA